MKTNGFAHAYVQFYCQWEKEILGRINSLPKLSPVGEPLLASEGGAAGVSLQGTFDLLRAAEELLKVQQRLRWAVQEIDPPYASETPEWSMLAYLDRNQEKLLFLERVDPGDSEITAWEVVLWDGSSKEEQEFSTYAQAVEVFYERISSGRHGYTNCLPELNVDEIQTSGQGWHFSRDYSDQRGHVSIYWKAGLWVEVLSPKDKTKLPEAKYI